MNRVKRCMWLWLLCLLPLWAMPAVAAETPVTYDAYLKRLCGESEPVRPAERVDIAPNTYASLGDSGAYVEPGDTAGRVDALIWASGVGTVDYAFSVAAEGFYELHITYMPLAGRGMDVEMSFWLDGALPFDRAQNVVLSRMYEPNGPITRDSRGNDIRAKLVEVSGWQTTALQDTRGYYAQPFLFYLTPGVHTLTIETNAESAAIGHLAFVNPTEPPAYSEPSAASISADAQMTSVTVQAESAVLCSSQTLYPVSERASAATQPSDPVKTRMNTIGGENWKQQGQWLEWRFTVPETGYYHMTLRALQEYSRGMPALRVLTIDGVTPFAEAAAFSVPYQVDWQMFTLGGDTPMALYLTAGEHTLRLTVAGSQASETLREMMNAISEMSALYRQIVVITGANADADRITVDLTRDFHLENKIPGFIDRLQALAATLRAQEKVIADYAGGGSEAALLVQIAVQLESFAKKPETVPARMEALKDNISSLSAWALRIAEQPMQLDYITFTPVGQPLPDGRVGFFEQIAFRWSAFVGSFHEDYSAVGEIYEQAEERKPLTVWVCANDLGATGIASGRDQTQLIKELIDQTFVPQTGIPVNLSLIDGSGTLMQATLGNKGPDVALTVYKELPVNLAMRGALVDLSQFEGYDEIAARFAASALVPYRYRGGVYALPETQNFYMIFYRADMFEELGLMVPDTWKEMKALIPVLNNMGMRVGVPEPTTTNNNTLGFQMHLFQRGLNYYTDDLQRTLFDQPAALEAFTEWTDLYTKYSLPVKYDFFSRFRTGEMPIAIDHYTMANTLAAAAPELTGLWDIAPIPGIEREDGSVDRSTGATGTGAVIMATSRQQQAAFDFISWWTSDETQTAFGLSLENLMGAAARWPTANQNAFLNMRWTSEQQQAILTQWAYVDDIPQLPGNYIINRNLSFAFRAVVYDAKVPREVLAKYNKDINKEIQRKWAEFEGIGEDTP